MKSLIRKIIRKSPVLGTAARAIRQHQTLHQEPRMTPWGFKFNGHAGMISGSFEPEETAIVKACLERADVFLNVGANIGFYCAHALSAGKTCIALEPHPDNVAMLLRNLKTNRWKAEIHPVACGGTPDILELYGGGTAASLVKGWAGMPTTNPVLVPILRLDDVIGQRFQDKRVLCLIDVEGAELHVLQGARDLLHRNPKPLWIVEICIDEHHATETGRNPAIKETFACFFDAGYRAFSVEGHLREVSRKEVDDIASGGKDTIRGHNFIFSDNELDWLKK